MHCAVSTFLHAHFLYAWMAYNIWQNLQHIVDPTMQCAQLTFFLGNEWIRSNSICNSRLLCTQCICTVSSLLEFQSIDKICFGACEELLIDHSVNILLQNLPQFTFKNKGSLLAWRTFNIHVNPIAQKALLVEKASRLLKYSSHLEKNGSFKNCY